MLNMNVMASITLEYDARNSAAKKIIEIITAMDNVFKVKTHKTTSSSALTRKALKDVEKGNVISCETYEDYLKHTAQYA